MTAVQRHDHHAAEAAGCAYRDIALITTGDPGDWRLAEAATCLARHFGSHLHVVRPLLLPMPAIHPWAMISDPTCAERCAYLRESAAQHNAAVEVQLANACIASSASIIETMYEAPGPLLAAACRATDLSLLLRPDDKPVEEAAFRGYFADLLLDSGRPVVALPPHAMVDCLLPRRVTVAWSGSRECARSVHDAIPLLQHADAVDVLTVTASEESPQDPGTLAESIVLHLARYGVAVNRVHAARHHRPVTYHILEHVARTQANMIVAGGYGHGRLREWALGGTTRSLLHDASVPVFFSH